MNNGRMRVRSCCPVCMFLCGMQMKSRQEQKGWEEQPNHSRTPG